MTAGGLGLIFGPLLSGKRENKRDKKNTNNAEREEEESVAPLKAVELVTQCVAE